MAAAQDTGQVLQAAPEMPVLTTVPGQAGFPGVPGGYPGDAKETYMTKPKITYYFCPTFDSFIETVATHVKKVDTGMEKEFGLLTFKVDDTPDAPDGSRMSQKELAEAYDSATGTYGMRSVNQLFDQEELTVIAGYYGGHGMETFTVDGDLTMAQYNASIRTGLCAMLFNVLLANCDEGNAKNIIVKIQR